MIGVRIKSKKDRKTIIIGYFYRKRAQFLSPESGFTVIELLVVVALMVIASTFFLNLGGMNCGREVRNDFDNLTGFFQVMRAKALTNNQGMQAKYSEPSGNDIHVISSVGAQAFGRQDCKSGVWNKEDEETTLVLEDKSRVSFGSSRDFTVCFYPDGTAVSDKPKIQIEATCGDTKHEYSMEIMETGFLDKLKRIGGSGLWKEL